MRLIKKHNNRELVIEYLKNGNNIKLLITNLNKMWDSFYSDVEVATNWSPEDRTRFLRMELVYEIPPTLKEINKINNFYFEIENNDDIFLSVSKENCAAIIANMVFIGIKFSNMKTLNSADLFYDPIYKNNLYKINLINIHFWLNHNYQNKENIDDSKILSIIATKPDEILFKYSYAHLDEIIEEIVATNPQIEFRDNQITMMEVFNSSTASMKTKNTYAEKQTIQIEDISKIKEIDVIRKLLIENKVEFIPNNLLSLFVKFGNDIPKEFSAYLSEHKNDRINSNQINTLLFSKILIREFYEKIISNPDLDMKVTETILHAIGIKIPDQNKVVDNEKAEALINANTLVMNENNLEYVRSNYPQHITEFEKRNLESFKTVVGTDSFNSPIEIVHLLESDLNGSQQKSLLSHAKIRIPYKSTYRFQSIKKYIIENRLDIDDLQVVIADKDTQAEPLLSTTVSLIIKNKEYIIQQTIGIPSILFIEVKENKSVSQKELIEIFSNSLQLYSIDFIKEICISFEISPFNELFFGKRPDFIANEINNKILMNLETKGIVRKAKNGKLYIRGM